MEIEKIKSRLVQEFGYSEKGAELVARQLAQLDPKLADAFSRWWRDGSTTDIEIEGFTVQRLMNEHRMNPIAAFLTLNWLLREPNKALISLAKGHDSVS